MYEFSRSTKGVYTIPNIEIGQALRASSIVACITGVVVTSVTIGIIMGRCSGPPASVYTVTWCSSGCQIGPVQPALEQPYWLVCAQGKWSLYYSEVGNPKQALRNEHPDPITQVVGPFPVATTFTRGTWEARRFVRLTSHLPLCGGHHFRSTSIIVKHHSVTRSVR